MAIESNTHQASFVSKHLGTTTNTFCKPSNQTKTKYSDWRQKWNLIYFNEKAIWHWCLPFRFVPYSEIICGKNNTARDGVPRAISDAMRSFPSGHAQLSTYVAIFMVVSFNFIQSPKFKQCFSKPRQDREFRI